MKLKSIDIGQREIFFFKQPAAGSVRVFNFLKTFIHFLNVGGKKGQYKFATANEENTLHKHLNIQQNIFLECQGNKLHSYSKENFEDYIKKIDNHYLGKLIKRVYPLERLPYQLNHEERKISVLVKALLSPASFLFFNNPELNLNDGNLLIFKQSLLFESFYGNKIIFLTSPDESLWSELATKIVTMKDNGEFEIVKNNQKGTDVLKISQNQEWKENRATIDKKVS
ncbi:MAG: hypothetical protein JNM93_05900 [Bacteriovoracaceae bacterium]|nr:hypothetical protein [Bacteriovoracaceae bacterium]